MRFLCLLLLRCAPIGAASFEGGSASCSPAASDVLLQVPDEVAARAGRGAVVDAYVNPYDGLVQTIYPDDCIHAHESAVAVQDGYILSNVRSDTLESSISKLLKPGGQVALSSKHSDTFESGTSKLKQLEGTIELASGFRDATGIEVTKDGSQLFVAHENGVSQFALNGDRADLVKVHNTTAHGVPRPAGACLSPDGLTLFIPTQGWNAMPFEESKVMDDALLKLDIASGSITVLSKNQENSSPNGCVVEGDKVWIHHMAHGIGYFDLTTEQMVAVDWDDDIEEQRQNFFGDGIVLYQDSMYVSYWKPVPAKGQIYRCTYKAKSPTCEKMMAEIACDMKLDVVTENTPLILLPNRVTRAVNAFRPGC